jgi:hypothetical protein
MTFTLNGIGTGLRGTRQITPQEYGRWKRHLPENVDLSCFYLTTKCFVILWLPLIPLQTFVLVYPKTKWHESEKYVPLFYPAGKGKVYWNHVKNMNGFYWTAAAIVALAMIFII